MENQLTHPVKLELLKDGRIFEARTARSPADLRCRIEMMTGVGWLDAAPLYDAMLEQGVDEIGDIFRVCHSYEKWGDLQQEVEEIEARLRRLSL